MAYGGGTFVVQNKKLPGSYINFVSAQRASGIFSDRGYGAMGLALDWGPKDEVMEVTTGDFQKHSMKLFGYAYTDDNLKYIRELFLGGITTLYAYRLNSGGDQATCDYGKAKYPGIRGNDLKIVISKNVDNPDTYDVETYLGKNQMDIQNVASAAELVDNDYIIFDKGANLQAEAGVPLENGTNSDIDGDAHQKCIDRLEAFNFNTIGVDTTDEATKKLYAAFTKRMRDEVGVKFQCVIYDYKGDYEGIINVKNRCVGDNISEAGLVYWVTSISAGCPVNKSNQNKAYNGELNVVADYTQSQLEKAIDAGEFCLHRVKDEIRVLMDINSMTTVSDTKGDIFKENQTIRVIDQIANDIATIFNTRYMGTVPNDRSGRLSLWADIVKHHSQLQDIRAIQDFADEDITVDEGDTKNSVVVNDAVNIVNAMVKLYMTCVVS